MLLGVYNPDSEAYCPTCKKVVSCYNTGGNMAFFPRYLIMEHEECGTEWRYLVDSQDGDNIKITKMREVDKEIK